MPTARRPHPGRPAGHPATPRQPTAPLPHPRNESLQPPAVHSPRCSIRPPAQPDRPRVRAMPGPPTRTKISTPARPRSNGTSRPISDTVCRPHNLGKVELMRTPWSLAGCSRTLTYRTVDRQQNGGDSRFVDFGGPVGRCGRWSPLSLRRQEGRRTSARAIVGVVWWCRIGMGNRGPQLDGSSADLSRRRQRVVGPFILNLRHRCRLPHGREWPLGGRARWCPRPPLPGPRRRALARRRP